MAIALFRRSLQYLLQVAGQAWNLPILIEPWCTVGAVKDRDQSTLAVAQPIQGLFVLETVVTEAPSLVPQAQVPTVG